MEFKETKQSEILNKFEKYKGYSAVLFDNEEWRESESYEQGYNQALKDSKAPEMFQALITTLQELEDINVLENHRNYIEQLIKQATEL